MASIKKIIAGAAAAAVVGGGMLLAAAPAFATGGSAPAAWEPDPSSLGSVTFFNSAGQPITSGTDLTNAFAYAEASNNSGTTGAKAGVNWAFPNHALPATSWFVQGAGTATSYPSANPAVLSSATNPVASNPQANISVIKGAGVNDATAGYNQVLQVRLYTLGGNGGSSTNSQYWSSDIAYNTTSGTWTEVASDSQNVTYTALTANPTSTPSGNTVTLTATETDESGTPVAGSYTFYNGTTAIASNVAVNGSGVATTTSTTLPVGADNLSAVFTPTAGGDAGSTQSTGFATETITGPATTTTLSVPTPTFAGQSTTLTATVTDANGGVIAGSVAFYDGATTGTPLGTITGGATGGVYALTLPSGFTAGTHNLSAVFTPTNPATDAPSTSPVDQINVTTQVTGACTNPSSSCTSAANIEAGIPVGTITITTPYNGTNCTGGSQPVGLSAPVTLTPGTLPNANQATSTPGCVNGVLNIGTLALTANDSMFTANTTFQDISVTDNLSANQPWTISAQSSDLSDGKSPATASSIINSQNVGLTSIVRQGAEEGSNAFTGTITPSDNPAAVAVASTATLGAVGARGLGLQPETVVTAGAGLGTYTANGTITLNAPTTTEAGLFTGTITFTVATS